MTKSMNTIIVSGLMATETFKERLALLMEQNCSFADQIMRCADPIIKSVKADPALKMHLENVYPFQISEVQVKVTEYGDIHIRFYVSNTFKYYVKDSKRYSNLVETPDLEISTEKDENFCNTRSVEGWQEINADKYMDYILVERV